MITLIWWNDKYELTYNNIGTGPAGDLYTPQLLEDVLTVCGMRQFYLPPSGGQVEPPNGQGQPSGGQGQSQGGGQGDDNVTCPVLPADTYDCTIPRLSDLEYDPYERREGKVKCPGLGEVIIDGLKNTDRKRGGKPPTVTDKFKRSRDFCVSP